MPNERPRIAITIGDPAGIGPEIVLKTIAEEERGLVLWAQTFAPIAQVTALRETSVLFAALLGVWLLKEKFGVQRGVGTSVIVVGVMALRLG